MSEPPTTNAHDQIESAWRGYASERGFQVLACAASPLAMRLAGTVRDVPLRIESYRATTRGAWPLAHISVWSSAAAATSARVRVTPRTPIMALADRLGFARLDLGDPELEQKLYVEGDPSARALFPPAVRAALSALAATGSFEYERGGEGARVTWEVEWPDIARLDLGVGLVVAACETELSHGMYR